jgi:hypothetical protein
MATTSPPSGSASGAESGNVPLQISLAPQQLWQAINPWTFNLSNDQIGLFNINLGQSSNPEVERNVLADIGSYGKQLGHVSEALEVLINHLDETKLSQHERDTLAIFKGDVAKVRAIKARAGG